MEDPAATLLTKALIRQPVIANLFKKNNDLYDSSATATITAGQFHIYAMGNINQAITLLTRLAAGEADAHGAYPDGSINDRGCGTIDGTQHHQPIVSRKQTVLKRTALMK